MRLDRLAGFCQKNFGPWATARQLVKNLPAAHGDHNDSYGPAQKTYYIKYRYQEK